MAGSDEAQITWRVAPSTRQAVGNQQPRYRFPYEVPMSQGWGLVSTAGTRSRGWRSRRGHPKLRNLSALASDAAFHVLRSLGAH